MRSSKIYGVGVVAGVLMLGCGNFSLPVSCPERADSSWVARGELADVYTLILEYNSGDVSLRDSFIRDGYFHENKDQPSDGYRVVLFGGGGETIFEEKFNFSLTVIVEGSGLGRVDQAERTLNVPAREDAGRIAVFDPRCLEILSLPVSDVVSE
jgi:hypothetical protein